MTNKDITGLLAQLETNEYMISVVLDMVSNGFSSSLIQQALEELHSSAESLKLGLSAFEEPYYSKNKILTS